MISEQSSGPTHWTYTLVLENRGRLAANVGHGYATLILAGVHSSPEELLGTPVRWRLVGKYEDRHHFVLDAEAPQ